MSKVFANAMGPNNMIPFFYRAKTQFDQEDITMATLVTRNRFPVLARLASNYKGKTWTLASHPLFSPRLQSQGRLD